MILGVLIALALQPTEAVRVQELMTVAGRSSRVSEADRPAEAGTRITAIRELGDLGAPARVAVPLLVRIAEDREEMIEVRSEALSALVKVDPPVAMPVLVRIAAYSGEDLSEGALETLSDMGEPALPAIIDVFRKSDVTADSTRDEKERFGRLMDVAARALAQIGRPAMGSLINALSDENENLRLLAADAFGEMGPLAADAIPALTAALTDASDGVPWVAATALGRIGRESVTPELLVLLSDRNERVRRVVAEVVKELGANGKVAVPAVVESLRTSSDEFTKAALVEALGAVGPDAAMACSILAEMVPGLRLESEAADKRVARTQLLRSVEKTLERIGCPEQPRHSCVHPAR